MPELVAAPGPRCFRCGHPVRWSGADVVVGCTPDGRCCCGIYCDVPGVDVLRWYETFEDDPDADNTVLYSEGPQAPSDTVDVDGVIDETRNIRFVGTARRQDSGKYRCLAAVGDNLCYVEVEITPPMAVRVP